MDEWMVYGWMDDQWMDKGFMDGWMDVFWLDRCIMDGWMEFSLPPLYWGAGSYRRHFNISKQNAMAGCHLG